MKKVFATLMLAALVIMTAVAQPAPAVKFGAVTQITSTLWNSDNKAASEVFAAALGFKMDAGNFGAVLTFLPTDTLMPAGLVSAGFGSGYTMSPFAAYPSDFYLWTKLFDGKVKLSAGQINDQTFTPVSFVFNSVIANKIATNAAGQGIDIVGSPIANLLVGVYVPLSDGEDAYKNLSIAAKYTFPMVAVINAGFIGRNKAIEALPYLTADVENFAAFASAQLIGVKDLSAYAGYEYTPLFVNGFTMRMENLSDIAVGAKYTGIQKLALSLDGELAFFDANASYFDGSSFGCQIAANAEYSIQRPYVAGLTAVYNDHAMAGINMAGAPWIDGQIGDDNCIMVNPYIAINPMGPPPFAKVTLGFQAFYQIDDFTTDYGTAHTQGDFFWAIPVSVTVVM
jgi:hypothetical protein